MMAPADAAPIPAIDVPAMATAADIIVVGRATGVAFHNALSETFSVSVDRALKGALQNPPTAVSVRLDVSRPEFQSVIQRQYGIFFLRRTVVGEYTAVDPSHAVLVASPDKAAKPTGPTDLLGGVTRELAQVFVTPPATLTAILQRKRLSRPWSRRSMIQTAMSDITPSSGSRRRPRILKRQQWNNLSTRKPNSSDTGVIGPSQMRHSGACNIMAGF
jgi:hypothetical protein